MKSKKMETISYFFFTKYFYRKNIFWKNTAENREIAFLKKCDFFRAKKMEFSSKIPFSLFLQGKKTQNVHSTISLGTIWDGKKPVFSL